MKLTVSTASLIMCLSETVDLISPLLSNHHTQVSCIAYHLSAELGFTEEDQMMLAFAGALHDVGGLTLHDRLEPLEFNYVETNKHSEKGYLLLKTFKPFLNIAKFIRYHHIPWNHGNCSGKDTEEIPLGSHLLHLADRIAILLDSNKNLFSQVDFITSKISEFSGKLFMPELVDAFINLSKKEHFWLDTKYASIDTLVKKSSAKEKFTLGENEFLDLIRLFSRIIDFRSHFTATHSSGVASTAEALARLSGFNEEDCTLMRIAGYLHDLGKIIIPTEILEKPGSLSKEEFDVIRTHTYFTDHILSKINGFDTIRNWSSLHHERLDGSGYPFHFKDDQLPMGARIMSIADIFVALTEDRPYRKGLMPTAVLEIFETMSAGHTLDKNLVSLIETHYDDLNIIRINAQKTAIKEYQDFMDAL